MKSYSFVILVLLSIIISCRPSTNPPSSMESLEKSISIPPGFQLETLYSPGLHDQGSWVALAEGDQGRMYVSDQFGKLYQFPIPEKGAKLNPADVDSINLDIGYANGLLWAFNSLYVSINKREEEGEKFGSGIYRLQDTNGDGSLDKRELLLKLNGGGEHGPHSLLLSPDGESIYFIAGNHTLVPEHLTENTRVPNNWGEDNLTKPYLDARGHANDIKAPGGWIVELDPAGKNWEIISTGYRNAFDMGFNKEGELFVYDADMEYDIGMPWYRPTRICHATSGSEFGWRTGTGKWPAFYPDALPAIVNMNQGSPTGVVMGHDLNFPAKYQNGLFANDWSFGTMYYVDLEASGSTYTGSREEFLSGTPLPLTDAIAGTDGTLYFATGGRRLESHLFRLSYTGTDMGTAPNKDGEKEKELRDLRHSIEAMHNNPSAGSIDLAWDNLDHDDRLIRYAARLALEHQPAASWKQRFYAEKTAGKAAEAAIARARQADPGEKEALLAKLFQLPLAKMETSEQIALLRAYGLVGIRMGKPNAKQSRKLSGILHEIFPSTNDQLNRQMGELLVFLGDGKAVEKSIALLEKHTREKTNGQELLSTEVTDRSERYGPKIKAIVEKMPATEAIYYGTLLAQAEKGWTTELREKYFQWFFDVFGAEGGNSFKATMESVRLNALAKVPAEQKRHYEELSGVYAPTTSMADLPQPKGPGKVYSNNDVRKVLREKFKDYQGTLDDGKRMYQAALCETCHRMNGEGGINGPDLSQINTRFNQGEIAYAILSPHEEVSDQYAHTLFRMKDGKRIAGRVLSEEGDKIKLIPNPFNTAETIEIEKADIEGRELSPISPMPPGLLNRLNEDELADLFAYLLSAGDPEYHYYGGEKGKKK